MYRNRAAMQHADGPLAVAFFALKTELPSEAWLFVITGFLGGLTTFSTFSTEVVNLLGEAQFGWALVAIGAHMLDSFAATAVGIFTCAPCCEEVRRE
jgi:fluoride exporter